jgi:hypothetical protein
VGQLALDRPLIASFLARSSRTGGGDVSELTVRDLDQPAADPRPNGIDVADVPGARKMNGSRGHGHWYANDRIAADVLLSLRCPIPPEKRWLVREEGHAKTWRMPDDYPDRAAKKPDQSPSPTAPADGAGAGRAPLPEIGQP